LQNAVAEKAAWWAAMWHASKEIASALIAGVVVVIVDWKRLLGSIKLLSLLKGYWPNGTT